MGLARAEIPARTGARAYFEQVGEAAAAAAHAVGCWQERRLAIDGTPIALRFAGEALLDVLFAPLGHLAPGPAPADAVTLSLWDTASTGVALPPVPWSVDEVDPRLGRVHSSDAESVVAYHNGYARTLTLFDRSARTGIHWAADASLVPWYERGSPLRTAFHLALAGRDRRLIHAGAVGMPSAGVLIGGASGSGKTTTALACLDAGLDYAGDDYVLVSLEPRPVAHSLYATAKADPESLRRFPALAASVDVAASSGEKTVLNLMCGRGDQVVRSLPVAAVVLPRVRGAGPCELRPLGPSAAARDLAPSTLIQMPHRSAEVLAGIARLLAAVPSYRLELGEDPREAAALVRDLVGAA